MKNLSNQGTHRRAYINTLKTGNAEWADFSCLPAGLTSAGAARSVGNARKAIALLALAASRSAPADVNAISFYGVNRP